ncbi:hypothetical protein ADEAN_000925000 [Angomonas deanei]|uniref:Uncharacterized protein n=1 Tax=Angomonas deanei TaxID=59799 RepID=A0A7G2CQF9_9TRYP|nr:hypothetical protein ADEAN_000925000 [Angomonas deanei]
MNSLRFLTVRRFRLTTLPSGGFLPSRRYQGSLQSLLADKTDIYLSAVQELDITRISDLLLEGPPSTPLVRAPPTHVVSSHGKETDATAVLAALAEEGAKRAAREEQNTAQEILKQTRPVDPVEQEVQHCYDGLCALNSVWHMLLLETDVPLLNEETLKKSLEKSLDVFQKVKSLKEKIPLADWEGEFLEEMMELRRILQYYKVKEDLSW